MDYAERMRPLVEALHLLEATVDAIVAKAKDEQRGVDRDILAALKAILAADEQKSLMGIVEAIPAARAAVEKAEGR